jgi:putative phosphoribosyl transferase
MLRNPLFTDRFDAGRKLGRKLKDLRLKRPVVLALPRGGVPVGFEVAREIGAPLDVLLVRKIGAPMHEELALGAVLDGSDPQVVINEEVARQLPDTRQYVERQVALKLDEIARRRELYRAGANAVSLRGRDAVIVDDGIATGSTVRAAVTGLRRAEPAQIIVATPVAPADAIETLNKLADKTVCLETPEPFIAVGLYYADFRQTEDDEVVKLLAAARYERDAEVHTH